MAAGEEETLLEVRVQPRASRNAVLLEPDGRVRIVLTAAPVDGAANQALREVLARALDVPRRLVRVVRGERSRDKTVAVAGMTLEDIRSRLRDEP